MADPELFERKSADRLAFDHYLRTGQRLSTAEWLERQERKFNQCHAEDGKFTFAPCGTQPVRSALTAQSSPAPRPGGVRRSAVPARPAVPPRTRVPAMPGYPETPRTAWRSSNDLAFIAAADFYNKEHRLKPGDKGYKTPEFLKAWAMRETGGEGNEREFRTDPFQVNNPGDWADEKRRIAGLRKGQPMTPAVSADAALRWLRYKSEIRQNGKVVGYSDDEEALRGYNGRNAFSRQSGLVPHKTWYARTIVDMANRAKATPK